MRAIVGAIVAVATVMSSAGGALAAPAPPVIVEPADGAGMCGVETIAVAGTAGAGETVRVYDGEAQAAVTVADEGGAWATSVSVGPGMQAFTLTARAESDGEQSEPSNAVSVNVDNEARLDGVEVSPRRISPANQDGRFDSTTASVIALSAGVVRFRVLRGSDVVTQGPAASVSAGGGRAFSWNGRAGGRPAGSGAYTMEATWSRAGCPSATAAAGVVVDNAGATVDSIGATPGTFHPRTDDAFVRYRDTTAIRYSGLSERASVTLVVYRGATSEVVRRVAGGVRNAGSGSIAWNGRDAAGRIVAPGRYEFALVLTDMVGNKSTSARRSVVVTAKRLVERVTTIRRNGDAVFDFFEVGCGDVATDLSDWAEGAYMEVRDCFNDDYLVDSAGLYYRFTLPPASYYHAFRLSAHGYSLGADQLFGFIHNYDAGEYRIVGAISASSAQTRPFRERFGSSWHRGRTLKALLFLFDPNDFFTVDYDIRYVELRVRYAVLV